MGSEFVQGESLHGYYSLGSDWKSVVLENKRFAGK
jgi:hypothetical protein